MGCCVSSSKSSANRGNHHNPLIESCKNGGAPPPLPPVEEETVKEVVLISETTIPILPTSNVVEKMKKNDRKAESTAVIKPTEGIISEVSEHSEMYSFDESFSTGPAQEGIDHDDEVTQKSPASVPERRLVSREKTGRRETGPRSPAKRQSKTPERKGQVTSSGLAQGREVTTQRRNMGPREAGEGFGRRSRSPATSGEVGRSQNGRYNDTGLIETDQSMDRSAAGNVESGEKEETSNVGVSNVGCESLENPVVSLECFIFL